MTTPNLRTDLQRDEGLRLKTYKDSVGVTTIGYGHAYVKSGTVWTKAQADAALDADIQRACDFLDKYLPWWRTLSDPRQDVLANMAFNLGDRLLAFRNTLALIKAGAYVQAASAMLQSKWAKQVGKRADRLAAQMRTGAVQGAPEAPLVIVTAKPKDFATAGAATIGAGVVTVAATQLPHQPVSIILGAIALTLSLAAVAGVVYLLWRNSLMSQALDNLTTSVGNLETQATAIIAEVNSLKSGSDDAALTALQGRIDTVASNLQAAAAPAAPAA